MGTPASMYRRFSRSALLCLLASCLLGGSVHADSRAAQRQEETELDEDDSHAPDELRYLLRSQAPARALHVARRVLWLSMTIVHPFEERRPPTSEAKAVLTRKPVPGQLSSPFGLRRDPVRRKRRKHHKGVDFVAKRGALVHAAGPGVIIRASRSGGYGRVVIVDHGLGLQTRYAHLQRIKVKKGEFVPAGAVVGTVGSSGRATGPHLHFEVRQDGVALPPSEATNFKLPPCSERARDCQRTRPNS